jgi:pyridoxamine 5'-phosphate oxidase
MRREYSEIGLRETDCDPDPVRQFGVWFEDTQRAGLSEANAVTLATATTDGKPSARIVLLKGADANGFVFFTNYDSQKGRELDVNPQATIVCFWAELARQVRIDGAVELASAAESDEYFQSRPRGSQLGAWCSSQSEVIAGREVLEARLREFEEKFRDRDVPRPPYWGGYRLKPAMIEFWQGRANRLHDRIRYRLVDGKWLVERLAP